MTSAVEHLQAGDQVLAPGAFARIAGLQESQLRELIDYQLLRPGALDMRTAFAVRAANRIASDFDLDLFTVGLLAGYLLRIETLEEEVQWLRSERSARTAHTEVSFTSLEWRSQSW